MEPSWVKLGKLKEQAGTSQVIRKSRIIIVVVVVDFYYSDMPETYIFDCKVQTCLQDDWPGHSWPIGHYCLTESCRMKSGV